MLNPSRLRAYDIGRWEVHKYFYNGYTANKNKIKIHCILRQILFKIFRAMFYEFLHFLELSCLYYSPVHRSFSF